jgi:signal recognition particle subunit SRP54
MFDTLSEKFQRIFKKIRGQSSLSEANMNDMLNEIKVALLEADVNYKVVTKFLDDVKQDAIGQQVLLKVNPSQMITKIVHDEIEKLLGSDKAVINYDPKKPTIIMLVGLQGTGKTTTAAKLGNLMKTKLNKKVLFAACDIYRPAAVEQLKTLVDSIHCDLVYEPNKSAVEIANLAKKKAYDDHFDVLIIDTAGRLQIDGKLMGELNDIKTTVQPNEILLLVDAMAGQDAVNVATSFNDKLSLTGAIMSKLDSDARGGAALSIASLSGVCIKFIGIGEKITDIDEFHPDRMADRILGMGDIVSLVEKVQQNIDEKEARRTAAKMSKGKFTLDDLLKQLKQIQKMGSLGGIMALIPGMPRLTEEQKQAAEKEMKLFETIINSMTFEERDYPEIIKNSRKIRIAKGSGTTSADINRLLNRFDQTKTMMQRMKNGGGFPPMGGMGGRRF